MIPGNSRREQRDFLGWIVAMLAYYFRPLIKGFLRLTTRLCELQRICYGEPLGGPRTLAVEESLLLSRNSKLRDLLDEDKRASIQLDDAVNTILHEKKIKKDLHRQFVVSMKSCLNQVWGYQDLVKTVETLRQENYDSDNLSHERMLLELWNLLRPGIQLPSRKTKDWQSIGFQGDDPKTDFRGMGILGLENLVYFSREYNSAAKYILSHSHHPKHGYSFAIVGINLTHMAYRLLVDGSAKPHFFNKAEKDFGTSSGGNKTVTQDSGRPLLEHFHHFYSYLFVEFDKFWIDMKPENVMQFNRIRDLFENRIRDELKRLETCFSISLNVETV